MKIRESSIVNLMGLRGIKTKKELAERCGWMPQALNRFLKNERSGFSSTSIDKFCVALDCQPGDFLYHEPDED